MNRITTTFVLSLGLLAAVSSPATSGVPSPFNSTTPPCFAPCPMGDVAFTVVVRDLANNPVAGSTVAFVFSNCTNAFICDPLPNDDYVTDLSARTLHGTTNAAGSVTMHLRVGGTGPAGCVGLFADGVNLRSYVLASPDQDGNGFCVSIIGNDDPIFAAKLGTADPTADFDCSGGIVDVADQAYFFHHHSHSCRGFVDAARRGTWGTLKLHYR
jgi:hypothetical protein